VPNNLELKARLDSIDAACAAADRCGAQFVEILDQTDTYFNVPAGRLKLREIAGVHTELIYYTRDEATPERWSVYETVRISDAAGMRILLEHAYGVRATVAKRRLHYQRGACRIHIDSVENLGTFLEFEVQDIPPEEAVRVMKEMREAFGVVSSAVIQASYEDLISQKMGRNKY
jgi:adenylate cyclase, class 2